MSAAEGIEAARAGRRRAKVSFFVHDLAANPVARAAPLALALARDYDVELVGFLLSGDEVYAPYRGLLPTQAMRCSLRTDRVLAALPALAARATGDVVYACKPLLTSLGPALWASRLGRGRPLLLDVEDDEWIPMGRSPLAVAWRDGLKGWRHATALKYTLALHPLTHAARAATVVSRKLERRYGGTVVLHGPDERVFDPALPEHDPARCRERFGLPPSTPLALFSGVPQPHKGWSVLLDALERPEARAWSLVLAGPTDHPEFARAKERLGARCHALGLRPYSDMPPLLAAVDAVPIPQLPVRFAESQVSAKALDALAMARALIASRLGDFPAIIDGDNCGAARGWLVEPGSPSSLAVALAEVARDPAEARARGHRARQWFLENASAAAIRARVAPLVEAALAGRPPTGRRGS